MVKSIKVTFIIKNKTDVFYEGREGSIVGLLQRTDKEKFEKLNKMALETGSDVSMKIGSSNRFSDRVDLNRMLRSICNFNFSLEPRRGYKLATFNVEEVSAS